MKNRAVSVVLLLCICFILFTGCSYTREPETVYNSEAVEVVKNGAKIAVYDHLTDKEYNFIRKARKRTEGEFKPVTSVDTDTIRIDLIKAGLKVYDKTNNKIFTMTNKGAF